MVQRPSDKPRNADWLELETTGWGVGGGIATRNVNYPLANNIVKKQGTNLERYLQHITWGSWPYYVKTFHNKIIKWLKELMDVTIWVD